MTAPWPEAWPEHRTAPPETPAPRVRPREVGLTLVGGLVGGLVLAGLWWLLAPAARELSDPNEVSIASDGTLVLLAVALGIAQGLFMITRRTPPGVVSLVVAYAAAWVGAATATVLGLLLGATEALGVLGAAGAWPVAMLVVVGLTEGLRYAMSRED